MAQARVEGFNFDTRKNVVQYDNVINRHRRVVYGIRRKILEGDDIKPEITRLIREKAEELVMLPAKLNHDFQDSFEALSDNLSEAKIAKSGDMGKEVDRRRAAKN